MKISTGGIGAVASSALASAGASPRMRKRYIWAWDLSGANSWYGNSGWLGLGGATTVAEKYGTPYNNIDVWGKQRGINYDQGFQFYFSESQDEGVLFITDHAWQGGFGAHKYNFWEYSQLNRDDGKPTQISSDLNQVDMTNGRYFHLILKTQGLSSPIRAARSGASEETLLTFSRAIGDAGVASPGAVDSWLNPAQGTRIHLTAEDSGEGSGILYTQTGQSNLGGPATLTGGKANTTYFGMTYNDASLTGTSHYDISDSPETQYTKDTYQNGDYRVIIWDFEDPLSAPSSSHVGPSGVHPTDASMFQFVLFCNGIDGTGSQITADNNSGKLGSANVSFMVCGMVLSDERLLNIPLPIDITNV